MWGDAASGAGTGDRLGDSGHGGDGTGRHAVVVLGYRNRGERANALNRFRTRAGLRSLDRHRRGPGEPDPVLVLCGGAVAGETSEAELMDRYAREELGFTGTTRLDTTSASTLDNIVHAIALLEDAESIAIVSNSHHAQKARIHLRRLRPDLAARVVRGADYRFGELAWVKPVEAVLGLRSLRALQRESGGR